MMHADFWEVAKAIRCILIMLCSILPLSVTLPLDITSFCDGETRPIKMTFPLLPNPCSKLCLSIDYFIY